MLVSVIIPSYNYEKTLPDCLNAIITQTYSEIEIIVVDDHSTDNSLNLAQSFNIKTLQTLKNSGVAAARNAGVTQAKGDIFMFVDADVVLRPDAIANAMSILKSDPSAVSVCGLYEPTPLHEDSVWEAFRSYQAYVWRAASVGYVSGGFFSLGLITRQAFFDVGFFNEKLRQTEEIDYGERLSRKGNIILSDTVVGKHDDDHDLYSMCRKFFKRSKDRVPFYLKKKVPMKGFELPRRLINTLLISLLNVLTLLLLSNIFFRFMTDNGQHLIIVLISGFIAIVPMFEKDMFLSGLRFFSLRRYILFVGWYWLFHTIAGIGVISGILQWLFSKRFRALYYWGPNAR